MHEDWYSENAIRAGSRRRKIEGSTPTPRICYVGVFVFFVFDLASVRLNSVFEPAIPQANSTATVLLPCGCRWVADCLGRPGTLRI